MKPHESRILAIDPAVRGFGFAVLEGPERLIDWGLKGVRQKRPAEPTHLVAELIAQYQPEVVVVEDYGPGSSRRGSRARTFVRSIEELAARCGIRTRSFSRASVRQTFAPSRTRNKHQIATVIAARFPELGPRLPPARKPWMSEDYRMNIFDAVALAVTYFEQSSRRAQAA